ncbi:MAG: DNA gyrase subunit A [Phycisphaeraceae bacterium]
MPDEPSDNTPGRDADEPRQIAPPAGNIVDLAIDRELQDSYLTYAMSTIMDRALPDVRDGLKPSQRRILVAMNDLNLGPRSRHRKCAKICGDTSGNYHPHGESVVYPTLVVMAQHWKMRAPLVNPQGNFGSIDGDPPAAMRYTEARMAGPTQDMLEDLKLDTVDYQENYDGERMEPTVLPGKFPNLLVNGGVGIAVGMATSLPPHNVGEICDAILAVIEKPDMELAELMDIVPGPDFPTGGTICGRAGIARGYATGRGRVVIRAKTHFEEQKNGKTLIVTTEIPYQVLKSTIIEQVVDSVKNERITDIADVRDLSGRQGMRLVVETKKGADPNVVLNQLYRFTSLQNTYSIMNIALVNRQPRTLGLREMIQLYIDHRREVITRRTRFLLRKAQQDAHIKEGLIYAVCDIDEVIRLIRTSSTRDQAIERLMQRGFRIPADHPAAPTIPQRLYQQIEDAGGDVNLSRAQAEAIGRMQLIQLVGLEMEKLVADYSALIDEIEDYEDILANDARVLQIVREDIEDIRRKYANDRRTIIEDDELGDVAMGDLIPVEDVVVTISHAGYVKRLPIDTYRAQVRGGTGVTGGETKDGDFPEHVFVASTHDDLLCFTNTGRVFKKKVYEIPQASRTARGRAIVNLLELRPDEQVRAFLPIKDFEKHGDYLVFATEQGLIKRTSLKLYRNVHKGGLIAVSLREGDRLIDVRLTSGNDHVLLCTKRGQAIRFDENDARAMGRSAAGVKGINLADDDAVVTLLRADDTRQLLTICENGYGKRTPMIEYLVQPEEGEPHPQRRGGKGRVDIRTTKRNGPVVTALSVAPEDQLMLISNRGMVVRTHVDQVRLTSRGTQGVRVIRLREGDTLVTAARIADERITESGVPADAEPSAKPTTAASDAPPAPPTTEAEPPEQSEENDS